jgi:hypothetical protein
LKIARRPGRREYKDVVRWARQAGPTNLDIRVYGSSLSCQDRKEPVGSGKNQEDDSRFFVDADFRLDEPEAGRRRIQWPALGEAM